MVAGAERPFEFLTLNLANQFDKEWFVTLFLHAMSDAGTLIDWKSPGLTDTESEATLVVLGRKSECHVHIHLSSVDALSSWPG